jgi:hypothetical protein
LHEGAFFGAERFELLFIVEDVGLIKNGVIGREEDRLAGKSGFDGIEPDSGEAFRSARASGVKGVRAIGIELSLRNGVGFGFDRFDGGARGSVSFTSGFEGLALSGAAEGTSRHIGELLRIGK